MYACMYVCMQTLSGSLRRRCVHTVTNVTYTPSSDAEPEVYCNFANSNKGGLSCSVIDTGDPSDVYTCVDTGSNPNHGFTSIDNVGSVLFTVFQASTMQGWSDIAYAYMDGEFKPSSLFLVAIILFANFFVINMAFRCVCWLWA